MDFLVSTATIEEEFTRIEAETPDKLQEYALKIEYCREILAQYRTGILSISLWDPVSEVTFFKEWKQVPQKYLLLFLELRRHTLETNNLGPQELEGYNQRKVIKIRCFLEGHSSLKQYLDLQQTHLDEFHFTRKYLLMNPTDSRNYYRDPEFSTCSDLLLSEIQASQLFLQYLQSGEVNGPVRADLPGKNQFRWTSSKINLIELIYGLHGSGVINNGQVSLKDLAQGLGAFFNINLGNFHHSFLRARERSIPDKFLRELQENFRRRIEELDR